VGLRHDGGEAPASRRLVVVPELKRHALEAGEEEGQGGEKKEGQVPVIDAPTACSLTI
jgi:hypothetical protein